MTKKELIFAEGCFDNFEGTQEDLDKLKDEITALFQTEDFEELAQPLSEEDEQELLQLLEGRSSRQ